MKRRPNALEAPHTAHPEVRGCLDGAYAALLLVLACGATGCGFLGYEPRPADTETMIAPAGPETPSDQAPETSELPSTPLPEVDEATPPPVNGCTFFPNPVFCEAFDDPDAVNRRAVGANIGISMVVNTREPGHRNNALGIASNAPSGGIDSAQFFFDLDTSRVENLLYMRFWYRRSVDTSVPDILVLAQLNPAEGTGGKFVSIDYSDNFGFGLLLDNGDRAEYAQSGTPEVNNLTPGAWTCVQVELDFADSGQARVWRNGSLVIDISGEDEALPHTELPAPIETLGAGAWMRGATDPFALGLDELIVSTEPIPCEP